MEDSKDRQDISKIHSRNSATAPHNYSFAITASPTYMHAYIHNAYMSMRQHQQMS